jgi:tRNA(Ile)-lysidine synthase
MGNKLVDQVFNTIKEYKLIDKGDRVLLGLSGGPDSVCLFNVLLELSGTFNFHIETIHINHMLREKESDEDEAYVLKLCNQYRVPLKIIRVDVMNEAKIHKLSIEEAAREARYREFDKCLIERSLNKIITAHNKNDQAETIFMRIIRGTGTDGLSGINYKRKNIIRPLLDVHRDAIIHYCVEKNLNPRIDSSNQKSDFTRNKIRNILIPFINNEFGGNLINSLVRLGDNSSNDADYLNQEAVFIYQNMKKTSSEVTISVKLNDMNKLHLAIFSRVIQFIIKDIDGNLKKIERKHIEYINKFIKNNAVGDEIHLPVGIKVIKSYETIEFVNNIKLINVNNEKDNPEFVALNYDKKILYGHKVKLTWAGKDFIFEVIDKLAYSNIMKKPSQSDLIQFFDYNCFELGINIRSRRVGDVFNPLGLNGHKKIKELYIDEKIPRLLRDAIPIITNGLSIAWVVGYRTGEEFKVNDKTKQILRIEVMKY